MKKKKFITGVAIGTALAGVMLGGCTGDPFVPQDLYGPPPESESGYVSEEPSEEELRSVETLYGPPADEDPVDETDPAPEEDMQSQTGESAESADETFPDMSSEYDTAVPLYGPPPDVES